MNNCALLVFPSSVRHRAARDLRGPGADADGPARPPLPGALHAAHQLRRGSLEKGAGHVLDGQRLCGEYQFDMSVFKKY